MLQSGDLFNLLIIWYAASAPASTHSNSHMSSILAARDLTSDTAGVARCRLQNAELPTNAHFVALAMALLLPRRLVLPSSFGPTDQVRL